MRNFPSKERFRIWLERMSPELVIASAWDKWSCPLCRFLEREGWNRPCVMAGDAGFLASDYNDEADSSGIGLADAALTPDWARKFTYWIDRIPDRIVTAEDCLFVLDLPYFERGLMTA